jgi:pilus assembly protein CpaC
MMPSSSPSARLSWCVRTLVFLGAALLVSPNAGLSAAQVQTQTPPPAQTPPHTQAQPPQTPPAPKEQGTADESTLPVLQGKAVDEILLVAGRSMVLTTDFDIKRIAITDPTIADGTVVSPRQVLVDGKKPGTISLILWGEDNFVHHEVVVKPAVSDLQDRLAVLLPGEDIHLSQTEGAVVLSGHVSSTDAMKNAVDIVTASDPKLKVINMLQLPGGPSSQQVLLQVRFAEVNRTALTQLGASFFTTRPGFTARSTTEQFPAPNFTTQGSLGELTFSDFLNVFFFQQNKGIGGLVKALQQHGDFQSLAEPNLIAYNGVQASFLAGGEFPVPVVSTNGAVSVTYKEFGVRLSFTPTIIGDVIRLHVRPEVSTLDFQDGVTISGFTIPALTERYAETEVELRDGQSFAIAGLLNNVLQNNKSAIPFLSQLPIIGKLFQSKSDNSNHTELMVLITPRLVRPLNPDEVPPLPTNIKEPARGGGGGGNGGGDTVPGRASGPGALGSALKGGGGLVDAPEPTAKPHPKGSGGA